MEDYFYKAAKKGDERSAESRGFFQAIMAAAGVELAQPKNEEALLGEFQRKGWYLAACCECPLEASGITEEAIADRFADSVAKRVRFSYRSKRVVLVSRGLKPIAGHLGAAGLAERLLLNKGEPVDLPRRFDPVSGAKFSSELRSLIEESTIPHRAP
jgi:hypothetical protein